MPSGLERTAVTVAAGVDGLARSQVPWCRPRTSLIDSARASESGMRGSAVIADRSVVPRGLAYQATPWTHPVSAPRGRVVAPSRSTAAPGATAAKSSFGQPGVPGSVARVTRMCRLSVPLVAVERAEELGFHRLVGSRVVVSADDNGEPAGCGLAPQDADVGGQQSRHAERSLRVDARKGQDRAVAIRAGEPPEVGDVVRAGRGAGW